MIAVVWGLDWCGWVLFWSCLDFGFYCPSSRLFGVNGGLLCLYSWCVNSVG